MQTKHIDTKLFWRTLGQRAIGSTIVTARSSEGPAGFLGLSATHVCAEPPLMLVSIDQRTSALPVVVSAGHFAIHFLPRAGRGVADLLAGNTPVTGAARLQTASWTVLATGAPVLANALGAMDCMVEESLQRHGISIIIGRVVDVLIGEGRPLVHFRGGYLE